MLNGDARVPSPPVTELCVADLAAVRADKLGRGAAVAELGPGARDLRNALRGFGFAGSLRSESGRHADKTTGAYSCANSSTP